MDILVNFMDIRYILWTFGIFLLPFGIFLLPFGIFLQPFGIFCGNLVYFVEIWYILCKFCIFCGNLVYFVEIWYILCGNLVYFSPASVCCTTKNLATLPIMQRKEPISYLCFLRVSHLSLFFFPWIGNFPFFCQTKWQMVPTVSRSNKSFQTNGRPIN
jgi:hypothetical protein